MLKHKILKLIILTLAIPALFLYLNPTSASVTSKKYKEYKAKYRNKEDKNTYFKIKTLKKDNPQLYGYYRSICDIHKFDTEKQFQSLPKKTQNFCNDYYTYRGYRQYVNWRNKHRDNSNNETTAASFVCGTDTVQDADGNSYDTVQVNDQCWMASNLRVGVMLASGATNPTNNSIIEKWCYNNDPAICATDGGLYNWNEAMQYVVTEGVQGICPAGWHIPTDAQWYALENYLKDEGQPCDAARNAEVGPYWGWECSTAGTKLKSGGASGMNFPMAGRRLTGGSFSYRPTYSFAWSSLESGVSAWYRGLGSTQNTVSRYISAKASGYSIRCLKD